MVTTSLFLLFDKYDSLESRQHIYIVSGIETVSATTLFIRTCRLSDGSFKLSDLQKRKTKSKKTKARKQNQPCQFPTRPYNTGPQFLLVNGHSALIGLLDS
jgi:hypothetical protein